MKPATEVRSAEPRRTEAARAPLVSVCVVTRNEEKNLVRCLESLFVSDFPEVPFELLVVDNASSDGTRARFDEFRDRHPSVDARWLDRSGNHLGKARKQAVENARGEVVLFIDADCAAPAGWMDGLHQALLTERRSDASVAAVGGGNTPPRDAGRFHDSLSAVLGSFIGSMGALQARAPLARREVDHLPTCNVAYRRDRVIECGSFSDFFPVVGEDLELSRRLRKRGMSLIFVPGLAVAHHHQAFFGAWLRKMFLYGRAQPRVAYFYPGHLLGIRAAPALALLGLLGLLWLRPALAGLLLVSYLLVTGVIGAFLALKYEKRASVAVATLLLVITHFGYAMGEIYGAIEMLFQNSV